MRSAIALAGVTNREATMFANGWSARTTPCFRVENADGGEGAAGNPQVYVYDVIGGYEGDVAEFVAALGQLQADVIDVFINSPGGFVYDGVSMYEALKRHPAQVNVMIDGMAASAASFVAQAGDRIEISKAGRMMIHDAQGIGIGGPADMYEYGDLLSAVSDDISGIYAARAGGKPKAWRERMSATTWYSASEAVKAKLADGIIGATPKPAPEPDEDEDDEEEKPAPPAKDPKKTSDTENRARAIRIKARVAALGGVK